MYKIVDTFGILPDVNGFASEDSARASRLLLNRKYNCVARFWVKRS